MLFDIFKILLFFRDFNFGIGRIGLRLFICGPFGFTDLRIEFHDLLEGILEFVFPAVDFCEVVFSLLLVLPRSCDVYC